MSSEPRLASGIWVQALLRRVAGLGSFAVVLRRGHAEAGAIALLLRRSEGLRPLVAARDGMGAPIWLRAGDRPLTEAEASAWVERAARIDPDLWVLEIEDPASTIEPLIPPR